MVVTIKIRNIERFLCARNYAKPSPGSTDFSQTLEPDHLGLNVNNTLQ